MEVDSEASWISISISISIDFEVDLEVLDDGKGFEAQRSMSQSEGSSCVLLAQRPGADLGNV